MRIRVPCHCTLVQVQSDVPISRWRVYLSDPWSPPPAGQLPDTALHPPTGTVAHTFRHYLLGPGLTVHAAVTLSLGDAKPFTVVTPAAPPGGAFTLRVVGCPAADGDEPPVQPDAVGCLPHPPNPAWPAIQVSIADPRRFALLRVQLFQSGPPVDCVELADAAADQPLRLHYDPANLAPSHLTVHGRLASGEGVAVRHEFGPRPTDLELELCSTA